MSTTPDTYSTFADLRGDAYHAALMKTLEAVADPDLDRQDLLVAVRSAIAEARDAVHAAASGGSGLSGHGVESGERSE